MKRYTAQEMLDAAETCLDLEVAYMLRQAADMMEREETREKKYEYGVKFHGCDGSARIDNMHFRSLSEANEFNEVIGLDETTVVRRAVGEWETVDAEDELVGEG